MDSPIVPSCGFDAGKSLTKGYRYGMTFVRNILPALTLPQKVGDLSIRAIRGERR